MHVYSLGTSQRGAGYTSPTSTELGAAYRNVSDRTSSQHFLCPQAAAYKFAWGGFIPVSFYCNHREGLSRWATSPGGGTSEWQRKAALEIFLRCKCRADLIKLVASEKGTLQPVLTHSRSRKGCRLPINDGRCFTARMVQKTRLFWACIAVCTSASSSAVSGR